MLRHAARTTCKSNTDSHRKQPHPASVRDNCSFASDLNQTLRLEVSEVRLSSGRNHNASHQYTQPRCYAMLQEGTTTHDTLWKLSAALQQCISCRKHSHVSAARELWPQDALHSLKYQTLENLLKYHEPPPPPPATLKTYAPGRFGNTLVCEGKARIQGAAEQPWRLDTWLEL